MPVFKGFPNGKIRLTPVPGPFFSDLLPEIDNLGELKLVLYAFWRLDHMEGKFLFLRRSDFANDQRFMKGLGKTSRQAEEALDEALEKAVEQAVFLKVLVRVDSQEDALYFLNSPKGRAALEAIQDGRWRPLAESSAVVELSDERPNIFRLYEENIGPLTPMIADALRDAETSFPAAWVEDAFRIAVENNVRRWRYIEAILNSWKEEGRDEQDRRDSQKDSRRYIEGEFSEFIEH